jgi:hypothetical protein
MKNSRMSLDAFKANAELANETIALDAIQGGNLFDCHGNSGQFGKKAGKWLTERIDKAIDSLIN